LIKLFLYLQKGVKREREILLNYHFQKWELVEALKFYQGHKSSADYFINFPAFFGVKLTFLTKGSSYLRFVL